MVSEFHWDWDFSGRINLTCFVVRKFNLCFFFVEFLKLTFIFQKKNIFFLKKPKILEVEKGTE